VIDVKNFPFLEPIMEHFGEKQAKTGLTEFSGVWLTPTYKDSLMWTGGSNSQAHAWQARLGGPHPSQFYPLDAIAPFVQGQPGLVDDDGKDV